MYSGSITHTLLPALKLQELELMAIKASLHQHSNNRTHAAAALGISVRTLQRKIRHYGIPSLPPSGSRSCES